MNPGAIFKFGSLEFRALRTPDNLLEIEEWINILYQVKEASLRFEDPIGLIEHYSMKGEDRFFTEMMGPIANLLKRKVKGVNQKLLDGMRLAQDIAYTQTEEFPNVAAVQMRKNVPLGGVVPGRPQDGNVWVRYNVGED